MEGTAADSELPSGGDDAQRLRVAGGKDRGRAGVAEKHPPGQISGLVAAVRAVPDPLGRDLDAGPGELASETGLAIVAGGEPERIFGRVSDEPATTMAEVSLA